jgi:hypothetical protein
MNAELEWPMRNIVHVFENKLVDISEPLAKNLLGYCNTGGEQGRRERGLLYRFLNVHAPDFCAWACRKVMSIIKRRFGKTVPEPVFRVARYGCDALATMRLLVTPSRLAKTLQNSTAPLPIAGSKALLCIFKSWIIELCTPLVRFLEWLRQKFSTLVQVFIHSIPLVFSWV